MVGGNRCTSETLFDYQQCFHLNLLYKKEIIGEIRKEEEMWNNNECVYTVSDRLMDVVRPLSDYVRVRFVSSTQFTYTVAYITDRSWSRRSPSAAKPYPILSFDYVEQQEHKFGCLQKMLMDRHVRKKQNKREKVRWRIGAGRSGQTDGLK